MLDMRNDCFLGNIGCITCIWRIQTMKSDYKVGGHIMS